MQEYNCQIEMSYEIDLNIAFLGDINKVKEYLLPVYEEIVKPMT